MTALLLVIIAAVVFANRKAVPQIASEAPIYAPLRVGDPAPPFAVTTLDGRRIDSAAITKPILLEVFATWCPHCQRETATLNTLRERFGGGLVIVSVSGSDTAADRSSPESLNDVRGFARYFHVAYPIAYDPNLTVAKHYLQGGFPTIAVIDPVKRIAAIESGEVSLKRLVAAAVKAGAK
ncbi:MAG: TlpA disulfide reductase family protein [Candidatus Baltobacteraceae bacterium]